MLAIHWAIFPREGAETGIGSTDHTPTSSRLHTGNFKIREKKLTNNGGNLMLT